MVAVFITTFGAHRALSVGPSIRITSHFADMYSPRCLKPYLVHTYPAQIPRQLHGGPRSSTSRCVRLTGGGPGGSTHAAGMPQLLLRSLEPLLPLRERTQFGLSIARRHVV